MTGNDSAPTRGMLLRWTVVTEGALLLVALGLMRWADLMPALDPSPGSLGAGLLFGVVSAAMAVALANNAGPGFRRIRQDFDLMIGLFSNLRLIDLALISVLAGMCEEALFRGFIQTWIGTWTSPVLAIAGAAVIFGLTHAISRPYVVFVTVLGAALGILYHLTGSLASVMLAHAVYDFIALYWGSRMLHPPTQSRPTRINVF